MENTKIIAEAEQAYERAAADGRVKTVTCHVQHYTQSDFPDCRAADSTPAKQQPSNAVCEFRPKLDSHSDGTWTVIPRQTGHRFRPNLDSPKS